jgi:hypothetical protein
VYKCERAGGKDGDEKKPNMLVRLQSELLLLLTLPSRNPLATACLGLFGFLTSCRGPRSRCSTSFTQVTRHPFISRSTVGWSSGWGSSWSCSWGSGALTLVRGYVTTSLAWERGSLFCGRGRGRGRGRSRSRGRGRGRSSLACCLLRSLALSPIRSTTCTGCKIETWGYPFSGLRTRWLRTRWLRTRWLRTR